MYHFVIGEATPISVLFPKDAVNGVFWEFLLARKLKILIFTP